MPGSVGSNNSVRTPGAPVGFDGRVQNGVDQRVPWCEEFGAAGVVRVDAVGFECGAFVAGGDRDRRSGALARADGGWHVGDLVAALFAAAHAAAEAFEGVAEEQFDVVGLEPSSRASSIWRRIMFSWCGSVTPGRVRVPAAGLQCP